MRPGYQDIGRVIRFWVGLLIVSQPALVFAQAQGTISGPAYNLLGRRITANQSSFYVYKDQDSGFNHGFPSGSGPRD
jgi:urea transporter